MSSVKYTMRRAISSTGATPPSNTERRDSVGGMSFSLASFASANISRDESLIEILYPSGFIDHAEV